MSTFFHEVIYASFIIGSLFTILRNEANRDFERIESTLGDDWYRIQSHIWSSDLQFSVRDLQSLVDSEIEYYLLEGSGTPLSDLFSDASKFNLLTNRLQEVTQSYNAYLSFNDILKKFTDRNQVLKKWLDFCILITGLNVVWGVSSIFFSSPEYIGVNIMSYLWDFFKLLIFSSLLIILKTLLCYWRTGAVKKQIRGEKSRYDHVLHGEQ